MQGESMSMTSSRAAILGLPVAERRSSLRVLSRGVHKLFLQDRLMGTDVAVRISEACDFQARAGTRALRSAPPKAMGFETRCPYSLAVEQEGSWSTRRRSRWPRFLLLPTKLSGG